MIREIITEALEANGYGLVNAMKNDSGVYTYLIQNEDGRKVSINIDENYVSVLHKNFGMYATSSILDAVRLEFNNYEQK